VCLKCRKDLNGITQSRVNIDIRDYYESCSDWERSVRCLLLFLCRCLYSDEQLQSCRFRPSLCYDKYVQCTAMLSRLSLSVGLAVKSIGLSTTSATAAAVAVVSSIRRSRYDTSDSGSFYDRDLTAVNQTQATEHATQHCSLYGYGHLLKACTS